MYLERIVGEVMRRHARLVEHGVISLLVLVYRFTHPECREAAFMPIKLPMPSPFLVESRRMIIFGKVVIRSTFNFHVIRSISTESRQRSIANSGTSLSSPSYSIGSSPPLTHSGHLVTILTTISRSPRSDAGVEL